MQLLHSPSTYPLGLDVSDSAVKLVQLKRTRRLPVLQAAALAELPDGLVHEGVVTDTDKAAALIRQALDKPLFGNFGSREAIVALPAHKSFSTLLTLPAGSGAAAVAAVIEKEFPYAIDEVAYDWQAVSRQGQTLTVAAAAAPREVAGGYRDLCQAAKLTPAALEPEPLAVARCVLPPAANDKTELLLDIGAKHSSCSAVHEGVVLFSLGMPLSGYAVSKKIADELKIPLQEAEAAKVVAGLTGPYLQEMVAELLERSLREAVRYLGAHYPAFSSVGALHVTGGGSAMAGLAGRAADVLGLPAAVADVFTNLQPPPAAIREHLRRTYTSKQTGDGGRSVRQSIAPRFAAVIGLALRGLSHVEW